MIDSWTRECLGLVADTSLSGRRVARELHNIVRQRGRPRAIVRDNGTEYTSNAILGWADDTGVDCHYIAPSKTLFRSLPHARAVLEVWRHDYNEERPHAKLGG